MIETIKANEEVCQEYRLISTFEMDARDRGFSEGAYQNKLENAATFKRLGIDIEKIAERTGLSIEEVEAL